MLSSAVSMFHTGHSFLLLVLLGGYCGKEGHSALCFAHVGVCITDIEPYVVGISPEIIHAFCQIHLRSYEK